MRWWSQWGARSNERAVVNARGASTELSRLRVEREEVELFLQQRYGMGAVAAGSVVADVRASAASR